MDWFTFTAQIVNFLILILLMKKFLYGPIINAMDEREARIAERMDEADAAIERAQRQEREHRELVDELEQAKSQMLQEASDEAEQRRKQLMQNAREEVRNAEQGWREALEREKTAFLKDIRERAGRETVEIARKALAELADDELEERVVRKFLERMDDVDGDRWTELTRYARESEHGLVISTAFDLRSPLRDELAERVNEKTGSDVRITFEQDAELITGIELRSPGAKIAWSVDDYIDQLQQALAEIVEQEAAR
jgi:F-type H+-transporting ATPase subunit b